MAESNTIYVPEYAIKTASVIASHYKPSENALTIRENIALDIDRLVYLSASFDDLLDNLKEHGYEVKLGKYISVKHPNAERFVRLKTIGEEYLPKNLALRIDRRNAFTDEVTEKMRTANPVEIKFHKTILNLTTVIKQFRLEPRKSVKERYYTFSNDSSINYLVEQLRTIGEFGLTSREGLYEKARELQHNIHEIRSQGCNPAPEEEKLRRVNELIKAYETIVEGNYIDNLIKAQTERKQSETKQQHTQKHRR